jgi:hypothetical protein
MCTSSEISCRWYCWIENIKRGVLSSGEGSVSLKIPTITGLAPFDWNK